MPDVFTKEKHSKVMSNIRGSNTKIEIMVRKYLSSKDFRYGKNGKRFLEEPDIVLPKYKTVIFDQGCFWHGHQECKYSVIPKTRADI